MVGCASKSALFSRRFRDSFKLSVFMGQPVVFKVRMDAGGILDMFFAMEIERMILFD